MNIKLHLLNEISIIESAGAYLETALDHYGFPVSRLQGQREQDICRANRELQVPTSNVPPGMKNDTPSFVLRTLIKLQLRCNNN